MSKQEELVPQSEVTIRSRYDRKSVKTAVGGESKTEQSHKKRCDINQILARYKKTGVIEHVRNEAGLYGDFTNAGDYQSALNSIIQVQEVFAKLPAEERAKMNNDPTEMLKLCEDPVGNLDKLYELGIASKEDVMIRDQKIIDERLAAQNQASEASESS